MKRIVIILLISIFTITLVSCKSDPEEIIYTRGHIDGGTSYIVSGTKHKDITLNSEIIIIPETYKDVNVARIEDEGFMNAVYLESLTIPKTVWNIGNRAFYNSFLKQFKIPKNSSLTSISANAFSYTYIEEIYLPDELYEIDNEAFSYTRLEEVFIPKSVERMGKDVF